MRILNNLQYESFSEFKLLQKFYLDFLKGSKGLGRARK